MQENKNDKMGGIPYIRRHAAAVAAGLVVVGLLDQALAARAKPASSKGV